MNTVLAGHGLVKKYGSTTALSGVDVEVGERDSLAIMGPSGSGKSTLLHTLAGIVRPDGGQVLLRSERSETGVPPGEGWERIDKLGENRLSALRRKRFGFVFQFGQLLPELPAEENVALPLMLEGMPRGRAVERARRWFAPLGIDGLEKRRPGQLSGGQAQRVAIARALVVEPDVVFADEPTGALDQTTSTEVVRLLTSVTREQGAALVMVTHDADVAAHCDRVLQVRDGLITHYTQYTAA
ncbi:MULTISPECIES: ABC transporter ATP-binding protein [Streptomyces]|uniref:ABC transporter ATP-binding protein n=1 Tax=Streptomyces plumbiresistens TaxID=511811 RepID=A0ABP7T5L7_9ACTN|nr:ABC transporter ATP-binding protein [Streptomyces sp. NBC_01373]MCX4705056.1 ABC transporter ATP-binding protein [Streptomyces sp. NBC_01373]